MIVGSHPHLLQKFSYVTSKDGRKVPVAYSLGNFCSNLAQLALNRYNIILNAELTKENNKVAVANIDYTPCCILSEASEGQFIIAPTRQTEGLSQEETDLLNEADKAIQKIIGGEIKPD